MTNPDIVKEVAGSLTKAQRDRVLKYDVLLLRNMISARVALNLVCKGIFERSRHLNQFTITSLGLAVRKILQGNPS